MVLNLLTFVHRVEVCNTVVNSQLMHKSKFANVHLDVLGRSNVGQTMELFVSFGSGTPITTGQTITFLARTCPNACSGNGDCNVLTGSCQCDADHYATDCSLRRCKYDCSLKGTCNNGVCDCDVGFGGQWCDQVEM